MNQVSHIIMSTIIPWDLFEEKYSKHFEKSKIGNMTSDDTCAKCSLILPRAGVNSPKSYYFSERKH